MKHLLMIIIFIRNLYAAGKFASTGSMLPGSLLPPARRSPLPSSQKQMTMAPPSEDELKAVADDLEANPGKARAMIHSYIMSDAFSNVPPAVGSSWMKCAAACCHSIGVWVQSNCQRRQPPKDQQGIQYTKK
jgi:hypothetical protein